MALAAAAKNPGPTGHGIVCNGHSWGVENNNCTASYTLEGIPQNCKQPASHVELAIDSGFCTCTKSGSGNVLRPGIGFDAWGGIDSLSCDGHNQTMILDLYDDKGKRTRRLCPRAG